MRPTLRQRRYRAWSALSLDGCPHNKLASYPERLGISEMNVEGGGAVFALNRLEQA
jgi:hypothetical protein